MSTSAASKCKTKLRSERYQYEAQVYLPSQCLNTERKRQINKRTKFKMSKCQKKKKKKYWVSHQMVQFWSLCKITECGQWMQGPTSTMHCHIGSRTVGNFLWTVWSFQPVHKAKSSLEFGVGEQACTLSYFQLYKTSLGWVELGTVSQLLLSRISVWSHKCISERKLRYSYKHS